VPPSRAIKDVLSLRQAYKAAFSTPDGKRVLKDLIKRYVLGSPVAKDSESTHVNIGMQRLVQVICQKVYGGGEEMQQAIKDQYETTNQDQE
jgi:hypothetical protein